MPGFKVDGIGREAPGRPDAYTTYSWRIAAIFADGHGGLPSGPPLIYLKDATLPTFTVIEERVKGASLEYKFANGVTWDDVRVTWYDTKGLLKVMKIWREMVWTVEDGLQQPDRYKRTTSLSTLLPDGSAENTWDLINSWPGSIKHGELTYTQSDIKLVDITIKYDWAVENPA